jgi:hypothetical protein
MRFHRALALGGVLAALAVSSLAAGASAATLSINPGGNITSVSTGTLTFNFGTVGNVICNITLTGTLATSLNVPTAGSYVTGAGSITGATANGCSGSATGIIFLAGISISGTIINSTSFGLKLVAAGILVTFLNGERCLYSADIVGTANTGTVTSLTVPSATLSLVGPLFPTTSCTATTGTVHGTLPITSQLVAIH